METSMAFKRCLCEILQSPANIFECFSCDNVRPLTWPFTSDELSWFLTLANSAKICGMLKICSNLKHFSYYMQLIIFSSIGTTLTCRWPTVLLSGVGTRKIDLGKLFWYLPSLTQNTSEN